MIIISDNNNLKFGQVDKYIIKDLKITVNIKNCPISGGGSVQNGEAHGVFDWAQHDLLRIWASFFSFFQNYPQINLVRVLCFHSTAAAAELFIICQTIEDNHPPNLVDPALQLPLHS